MHKALLLVVKQPPSTLCAPGRRRSYSAQPLRKPPRAPWNPGDPGVPATPIIMHTAPQGHVCISSNRFRTTQMYPLQGGAGRRLAGGGWSPAGRGWSLAGWAACGPWRPPPSYHQGFPEVLEICPGADLTVKMYPFLLIEMLHTNETCHPLEQYERPCCRDSSQASPDIPPTSCGGT